MSRLTRSRVSSSTAILGIEKTKKNPKITSVHSSPKQESEHSRCTGKRETVTAKRTSSGLRSPILRDSTNTTTAMGKNKIVKKVDKAPEKTHSKLEPIEEEKISRKDVVSNKVIQSTRVLRKNSLDSNSGAPLEKENNTKNPQKELKNANAPKSPEKVLQPSNELQLRNKNILGKKQSVIKNSACIEQTNIESQNKVKGDKDSKLKNKEELANRCIRQLPKRKPTGKCQLFRDSSFKVTSESSSPPDRFSKKILRQRSIKNYFEESKNSDNSQNQENLKINNEKKTIPIYKTIQLSTENVENKEKVYEFLPDDDSLSKDKKKIKGKKPTKKKSNKVSKKSAPKRKKVHLIIEDNPTNAVKKVPKSKTVSESNISKKEEESLLKDALSDALKYVNNLKKIKSCEKIDQLSAIKRNLINIIGDEKLEGKRKINLINYQSTPKIKSTELKINDSTDVLTMSHPVRQYNKMANHSLMRGSISPIKKTDDSLNINSPALKTVETFSRVQQVVQSTPQINKRILSREQRVDTLSNKKEMESSNNDQMNDENIDDTSRQMLNSKSSESLKSVDVPKSPRKFGTVLSNEVSPRKSSSSNNSFGSHASSVISTTEAAISAIKNKSRSPVEQQISSILKAAENKENTKPNVTPEKITKKSSNNSKPEPLTPTRRLNLNLAVSKSPIRHDASSRSDFREDSFQPEPGPSWRESPPPQLKQSNLDHYLNLDEVPQCSHISTPHGIFDDLEANPVRQKNNKVELGIENAFGFDEVSYDADIKDKHSNNSIIATAQHVKASKKGKVFPNARIKSSRIAGKISESIPKSPIAKNKDQEKTMDHTYEDVGVQTVNLPAETNNNEDKNIKEKLIDAISFSDTFDMHSGRKEDFESELPEEVPLFLDLQPVHFREPPRKSYSKRKRVNFFDSFPNYHESDSEDEHISHHQNKKKKISKKQLEEKKKLDEWAKNLNKTFEEIDHYDLVVE